MTAPIATRSAEIQPIPGSQPSAEPPIVPPKDVLLGVIQPYKGKANQVLSLVMGCYSSVKGQVNSARLGEYQGLFALCRELGATPTQLQNLAKYLLQDGQTIPGDFLNPSALNAALPSWVDNILDARRTHVDGLPAGPLARMNRDQIKRLVEAPVREVTDINRSNCVRLGGVLPTHLLHQRAEVDYLLGDSDTLGIRDWVSAVSEFERVFDLCPQPAQLAEHPQAAPDPILTANVVNFAKASAARMYKFCDLVARMNPNIPEIGQFAQNHSELINRLRQLPIQPDPNYTNARCLESLYASSDLIDQLSALLVIYASDVSKRLLIRAANGQSQNPAGAETIRPWEVLQNKVLDFQKEYKQLCDRLPDYLTARMNLPSRWSTEPPQPNLSQEARNARVALTNARVQFNASIRCSDLGLTFKDFKIHQFSSPAEYLSYLTPTQVLNWAKNKLTATDCSAESAAVVFEAMALKGLMLAWNAKVEPNSAKHMNILQSYKIGLSELLSGDTLTQPAIDLLNSEEFVFAKRESADSVSANPDQPLSGRLLQLLSEQFKRELRDGPPPTCKGIMERICESGVSIVGDLEQQRDPNAWMNPISRLSSGTYNLKTQSDRLDWSKRFLESAFKEIVNHNISPRGRSISADQIKKLQQTEFKAISSTQTAVLQHCLADLCCSSKNPSYMVESLVHAALIADGFDPNAIYRNDPLVLTSRSFEEKGNDNSGSIGSHIQKKTLRRQANFLGVDLSKRFEDKINNPQTGEGSFAAKLSTALAENKPLEVSRLIHLLIMATPPAERRASHQEISDLMKLARKMNEGSFGYYTDRKGELESRLNEFLNKVVLEDATPENSAKLWCTQKLSESINQSVKSMHQFETGGLFSGSKNKALKAGFDLNREAMALRFYRLGFPLKETNNNQSSVSMGDLLNEINGMSADAREFLLQKWQLQGGVIKLPNDQTLAWGDKSSLEEVFSEIDRFNGQSDEMKNEVKQLALARCLADSLCGSLKRPRKSDKDSEGKAITDFHLSFNGLQRLQPSNRVPLDTPILKMIKPVVERTYKDIREKKFNSKDQTVDGYVLKQDEISTLALNPHGLYDVFVNEKKSSESSADDNVTPARGAAILTDQTTLAQRDTNAQGREALETLEPGLQAQREHMQGVHQAFARSLSATSTEDELLAELDEVEADENPNQEVSTEADLQPAGQSTNRGWFGWARRGQSVIE